jgi:hypothetical protein
MNRFKFALALMVLAMAMFTSRAQAANEVQIDRFEFGVSAGVGFYVGQHDPLGTGVVTRVQTYDAVGFPDGNDHGMPGVETFGFSVGYRFNPFWHIKAQTTRQRVSFVEYLNKDYATHALYYNAMWHTDVMAEYNLLPYGLSEGGTRVRKFTPYIGFGIGVTVYNKNAHLRKVHSFAGPMNNFGSNGCIYTCYPRVGQEQQYANPTDQTPVWVKAETACALYIPFAAGVKWRINDNIQLKGTFQYQLFFSSNKPGGLNSNLDGGSYGVANLEGFPTVKMEGRPTFDQLHKQIVGANHDCLFSVSAIFNFGKWYEDRLITY